MRAGAEGQRRRVAGGPHDGGDVGRDLRLDAHRVDRFPQSLESRRIRHRGDAVGLGPVGLEPLDVTGENPLLHRGGRIPEQHFDHEPIQLRLRERIGALELDRVLRREHRERRRQRMRDAVRGDGALLHRLEQGGLGLRRRAVDFVGEHQVGEDRTRPEPEFVRAGQHRDAGDVRRHQVGRELDALELDVERQRQRTHQQRLGGAGDPLEQGVPPRQQADDDVARRGLLSQNHLAERRYEAAGVVDG